MTPKEYLKERLKSIFNSIKTINIKYQYCAEYDTHIVEVTPLNEFDNNNDYIAFERDLLFDFNELYFPSTLIFATEDSLNRVDNPEFLLARRMKESFMVKDIENYYSILDLPELSCHEDNFSLAA